MKIILQFLIHRWWFIVKNDYKLGSRVIMKKAHPCGTNEWEIIRVGADIKIKCLGCGRSIVIPRVEFNKKLKKIIEE